MTDSFTQLLFGSLESVHVRVYAFASQRRVSHALQRYRRLVIANAELIKLNSLEQDIRDVFIQRIAEAKEYRLLKIS